MKTNSTLTLACLTVAGMRRQPRAPEASLFERGQLLRGVAQGLILLTVLIGLFAFTLHGPDGVAHVPLALWIKDTSTLLN